MPYNVGILLFDEVEVLDFAGPYEVFSITTLNDGTKGFNVFTCAPKSSISARNGLKVIPDKDIQNITKTDILIIPGGYGAEKIEINNDKLLNWIKGMSDKTQIIASVCTGAFLLAKIGLLNGKDVITHWMDIDELQKQYPQIKIKHNVRYTDNGRILTSGGISAGIEMSLHIIKRLYGEDIALKTAQRMEYRVYPEEL